MCYTYDNLSRVIEKTVKNSEGSVISTETFDYDAAGNIIGDTSETIFEYDTNNRLEMYNGFEVTYEDGNMVSNSESVFDYDSSNRLVRMDGHFYTYNAEDVRIKCVCDDNETTYTYNTNCKLSQLLTKTTNGIVTKYVYGLGLIGEESSNTFRTYHFDFRGSTVAVTDASGTVTDTFAYNTYGKCIARTGTSDIIFGYNGRDGVVTDTNGLCYMRARYYSPDMRRFINADIIAGKISNAVTLNRYAYANGNPVSNVDPFGLSPERGKLAEEYFKINRNLLYEFLKAAGVDFDISNPKFIIDFSSMNDQIKLKLNGSISYDNPFSIEDNRGLLSPDLTFFLDDVDTRINLKMDWERIGVEKSIYIESGEWTFQMSHVNGLKSEMGSASITYNPTESYLPSMSLSVEGEIGTSVKVGAMLLAFAFVYAPEAGAAALSYIQEYAPEFVNNVQTIIYEISHIIENLGKSSSLASA